MRGAAFAEAVRGILVFSDHLWLALTRPSYVGHSACIPLNFSSLGSGVCAAGPGSMSGSGFGHRPGFFSTLRVFFPGRFFPGRFFPGRMTAVKLIVQMEKWQNATAGVDVVAIKSVAVNP